MSSPQLDLRRRLVRGYCPCPGHSMDRPKVNRRRERFIEAGFSVPMCHTDHAAKGDSRNGGFAELRQITRVIMWYQGSKTNRTVATGVAVLRLQYGSRWQ